MKTSLFGRSLALLTLAIGCHVAVTAAPSVGTAFTYQGRLINGGIAANGNYDLSFALHNDSSGGAAIATVTNLNVAVSNGLFTASVDFGTGLFSGAAYWLELGARTNGGGAFAILAPRNEVTPTPYALYAAAAPLVDGAVTSAKILDGAVATADLADNSVTTLKILDGTILAADLATSAVTSAKILDGAVANADLGPNAVTTDKILDGTIVGLDLAANTVASAQLADNIDLGSSALNGVLNVYRNAAGTPGITLTGSTSQISTYGSDGLEQVRLGNTSYGELRLNNSLANNGLAAWLTANAANGGFLGLYNTNGATRASLSGANTGGTLTLYQADSGVGVLIDGDNSGSGLIQLRNTNGFNRISLYGQNATGGGKMGIHDNNGTETGELLGQATATTGAQLTLKQDNGTAGIALEAEESNGRGGRLNVYNSTGNLRAFLDGDYGDDAGGLILYTADGSSGVFLDGDSGGAGYISVYNTNGSSRVVLDGSGSGSGGQIYGYAGDGSATINIQADNGGAGLMQVRNNTGSTRINLDGESTGSGGEISVFDTSGTETIEILGAESSTEGGQILMRNAAGTSTIQLDSDGNGVACGYMALYNSNGVASITLQADYAGDGRITTQELVITGGSDLSENFDIQTDGATALPGMVVCIDPQRPGELMPSSKAYDRTVAGIISGAGGVRPGMMMGQKGTKADGKHPVALTGRVYCQADASQGAIQPGDLLTTSALPGHAMKATDHNRAQGAIIGKAMTALENGKGLVLVLVSLQ